MNVRRSLLIRILVTVVFVFACTSQASAGYFPPRPAGGKLTTFTGVLTQYGLGNGTGSFDLTIGATDMTFMVGLPMKMNGKEVACEDPDPEEAGFVQCTDWPSAIVVDKSVVTATCWSDATYECKYRHSRCPGTPTWFCDEIDSKDWSHPK